MAVGRDHDDTGRVESAIAAYLFAQFITRLAGQADIEQDNIGNAVRKHDTRIGDTRGANHVAKAAQGTLQRGKVHDFVVDTENQSPAGGGWWRFREIGSRHQHFHGRNDRRKTAERQSTFRMRPRSFSASLHFDESALESLFNQVDGLMDVEFFHDIMPVRFNRRFGQKQQRCNFALVLALGNEA